MKKNPNGKVPLLETEQGQLYESNSIIRYLAQLKPSLNLLGTDLWSQALVNQWLDWSTNELEPPILRLSMTAHGWIEPDNEQLLKAAKDAISKLEILNVHLKSNTFLVGNNITIADIAIASLLVTPMTLLLDEEHRKQFLSVSRWFETIISQVPFKKVCFINEKEKI